MSHNRNRNVDRHEPQRPDPDLGAPEVLEPEEEGEVSAEDMVKGISTPSAIAPNCLIFNTAGWAPVMSRFHVPISQLKKEFLRICKEAISDVDEIYARYDETTGDTFWFLRFAEGSAHFTDGSMAHTALSDQPSSYLSKEVKEFAKKFGMDPKADLLRDRKGNILNKELGRENKIVGGHGGPSRLNSKILFIQDSDGAGNRSRSYSMRLSYTALLKVIFDLNGAAFKLKYGKTPPKVSIHCEYHYASISDHKYGEPQYMIVEKSLINRGGDRPMPREAYRYKEM